MINQVTLVGRLTKDPELKTTPEGTAVAQVTLAVNRNFRNHNGEFDADFVHCTLWRKAAENTCNYCRKGALVGITGRLQTRHYDNREGKRVYVIEVVAESVRFLSPPKAATAGARSNPTTAEQYTRAAETLANSAERNNVGSVSHAATGVPPHSTAAGIPSPQAAQGVGTSAQTTAAGSQTFSAERQTISTADQHLNENVLPANDRHMSAESQAHVTVTEWHASAGEQKKEERELAF